MDGVYFWQRPVGKEHVETTFQGPCGSDIDKKGKTEARVRVRLAFEICLC